MLMLNCSPFLVKDTERNNFFSAALGFILPVAYSYQPDLTVIVVGPNRSLGINGISLLTSLLKGLAESRILAVIQVIIDTNLDYLKILLIDKERPYLSTIHFSRSRSRL